MSQTTLLCLLKNVSTCLIMLLALASTFTSCAPFKALNQSDITAQKIEGRYKNKSLPSQTYKRLSNGYLWEKIDWRSDFEDSSLVVELTINPKNKIVASLYDGDTLLKQKVIKGKFRKNGCYHLRRKGLIIPLPPLIWGYGTDRNRIYVADDHLIWENSHDVVLVILVLFHRERANYDMIFQRVSQD